MTGRRSSSILELWLEQIIPRWIEGQPQLQDRGEVGVSGCAPGRCRSPRPAGAAGGCAPPSAGGWRTARRCRRPGTGCDHQVRRAGQLALGRQRQALVPAWIFRSALARASGSRVSVAPDASAWYSRLRLMASWMTLAASGPRISMSSRTPGSARPRHRRRRAAGTIARLGEHRDDAGRAPPRRWRSGCPGCRRGTARGR